MSVLFQNKLWQLLSDGIIAGLLTLGPRLVSYSAFMVGPTYGCQFLYRSVHFYDEVEKCLL